MRSQGRKPNYHGNVRPLPKREGPWSALGKDQGAPVGRGRWKRRRRLSSTAGSLLAAALLFGMVWAFFQGRSYFAWYPKVEATTLTGTARVLDGDTIEVAGVRIRLNGIDAEEVGHGFSAQEPNGAAARAGMQMIVSGGPVRCALNGERTYDRMVGVCFNKAGEDIGAELVRMGLALDCRRFSGGRYRSLEPASARGALMQKPYC